MVQVSSHGVSWRVGMHWTPAAAPLPAPSPAQPGAAQHSAAPWRGIALLLANCSGRRSSYGQFSEQEAGKTDFTSEEMVQAPPRLTWVGRLSCT